MEETRTNGRDADKQKRQGRMKGLFKKWCKEDATVGHEVTVHSCDTSYLLAKVIVNVVLWYVQKTRIG